MTFRRKNLYGVNFGTFLILSILVSFLLSCRNEGSINEERCNCGKPPSGIVTAVDTSQQLVEESISTSPKFSASGVLKKFIDAEISAAYSKDKSRFDSRQVINRIGDKFPGLTSFRLMKYDTYCRIVEVICADTSLTDKEVIERKLKELDKVGRVFDSLYLSRLSDISTQVPEVPNIVERKPIYTYRLSGPLIECGFRHDLIEFMSKELKWRYDLSSSVHIELKVDPVLIEKQYSSIHFQVHGINIIVYKDKEQCSSISIEDYNIPIPTISGTKELLNTEISKYICQNLDSDAVLVDIQRIIKNCIL